MRLAVAGLALALALAGASAHAQQRPAWAIAIHGGTGGSARGGLSPQSEAAHRAALARSLKIGTDILSRGGTSLDAVEAVVRDLEDEPLFNAGKGAVFNADGAVELDAAVMDGATLGAGAVAGVSRTRNPISLARRVMKTSGHVLLMGEGADRFSKAEGLEQVDNSYFYTEHQWRSLERALAQRGLPVPPRPASLAKSRAALEDGLAADHEFGTVGVVALDSHGDLAAGTSTGGMVGKRWGRVGDSPIIGAGTYASNQSCAVSGTGKGEVFIRLTLAREVCALVQHKGLSLQSAADELIGRVKALGGGGGLIAVAPNGDIAWSYNTPSLFRAKAVAGQPPVVAIFPDEP
ncbi:isoaspartyl peptidase/L-asparaginase family protein [Caulobacter mirabilis]|uniref:Isoaspartyl peptidase n=1 Tax=Caulobacter mirabilis TaxID=69666 RepID=A0A2D2AZE3_9CAUL|nr:isoaspartyl peptidase/L-asparaginase [Caulobacter mirabilis]ATQ43364.1 isoaspartyl peptidase/L-asparaginase [Caulobacter mirabilis]